MFCCPSFALKQGRKGDCLLIHYLGDVATFNCSPTFGPGVRGGNWNYLCDDNGREGLRLEGRKGSIAASEIEQAIDIKNVPSAKRSGRKIESSHSDFGWKIYKSVIVSLAILKHCSKICLMPRESNPYSSQSRTIKPFLSYVSATASKCSSRPRPHIYPKKQSAEKVSKFD